MLSTFEGILHPTFEEEARMLEAVAAAMTEKERETILEPPSPPPSRNEGFFERYGEEQKLRAEALWKKRQHEEAERARFDIETYVDEELAYLRFDLEELQTEEVRLDFAAAQLYGRLALVEYVEDEEGFALY